MIFTVDYRYDEPFLPTPRCRKLRHREANGSVEVNVPFIFKEQAHPAFCVTEYDMHASDFVPWTIYQYAGKLWKLALKDNFRCGAPHEPATVENLRDVFERYNHCQHAQLGSLEEEANSVYKYAKGFLLIDGELYRPCGEPLYNITTFGLGHNHGGTSFFVEYGYNPNISHQNYFNALHRAEAIEYAIKVASARGDTESIPRLQNPEYNIEVLDPTLVHRDPAKDHGDGNPFLNTLEDLCTASNSVGEAAALVMCAAAVEQKKGE